MKQKFIVACLALASRCGSLSITASLSLLVNEFIAGIILHKQVSWVAVNHISVDHEVLNGCKKKNNKIH